MNKLEVFNKVRELGATHYSVIYYPNRVLHGVFSYHFFNLNINLEKSECYSEIASFVPDFSDSEALGYGFSVFCRLHHKNITLRDIKDFLRGDL
jgi:hypothetical protein